MYVCGGRLSVQWEEGVRIRVRGCTYTEIGKVTRRAVIV